MTKPDFAAHLIEGIEHFNSRRFWEAHEAWEMIWLEAPKWVTAIIYMSLGWFAIVAFPELWQELGIAGTLLVGAGGLLYTAGAVVYATQRPDPNPAVFGYHEIFHLFVIAAAAAQFAAIAFFALPSQ